MKPAVVLVRPQMGENIGAVARAMMNFGLEELRLVAPRDGWPNPKAHEMSAHADYIIEAATLYPDLTDAIADCHLVATTSARNHCLSLEPVPPREGIRQIDDHARAGQRCAIVLGPERSGLTSEEVARAQMLIHVPTAPENPSLNLAQCMVILGYEWWMRASERPVAEPARPTQDLPATAQQLERLHQHVTQALDQSGFFRAPDKRPRMLRNLRVALGRGQFTAQDVQTFHGMLRALVRN